MKEKMCCSRRKVPEVRPRPKSSARARSKGDRSSGSHPNSSSVNFHPRQLTEEIRLKVGVGKLTMSLKAMTG